MKKVNKLILASTSIILLTGCSNFSNIQKKNIPKKNILCKPEKLYKIKSFEQQIKDSSLREGFYAQIINNTAYNPVTTKIDIKDLLLENNSNIVVNIPRFLSKDKKKKVFIFEKKNDELIKQLKNVYYSFKSPFIAAGEFVNISKKNDIFIEMPLEFQDIAIPVEKNKVYNLYELLDIISIEIIKNKHQISFKISDKIRIESDSKRIKVSDQLLKFLKNNKINYNLQDNDFVLINDSFKKYLYLNFYFKDKENLYKTNNYFICNKNINISDGEWTKIGNKHIYIKKTTDEVNNSPLYNIKIKTNKEIIYDKDIVTLEKTLNIYDKNQNIYKILLF